MNKTQIAIIVNENKLAGKLTKILTGCYAYHTAIVINDEWMFDITTKKKRKVDWKQYSAGKKVFLYDSPVEIPLEYLESGVWDKSPNYGYLDYFFFFFRFLLSKIGVNNIKGFDFAGVICSEFANETMNRFGWKTPFDTESAPPDPCRLWAFLRGDIL